MIRLAEPSVARIASAVERARYAGETRTVMCWCEDASPGAARLYALVTVMPSKPSLGYQFREVRVFVMYQRRRAYQLGGADLWFLAGEATVPLDVTDPIRQREVDAAPVVRAVLGCLARPVEVSR